MGTVSTNILKILTVIFSPLSISTDDLSFNLQNFSRFPILNLWHSPFLVIGFIVSLRRIFYSDTATSYPYAALWAMTFLTFGLALFSAIGMYDLPITRIIIGFLPLAGFIVVGVAWTFELLLKLKMKYFVLGGFIYVFIFAMGVNELIKVSSKWRDKVQERSIISTSGDQFTSLPDSISHRLLFMQARFKRLSKLLGPIINCKTSVLSKKALIVKISPSIIMDSDKYEVVAYLNQFNDLSPTLSLYLSDLGFNTGYVIAHSENARGIAYLSHSYLGEPRKYSGPIRWEDKKIKYVGQRPFIYSLKTPSKSFDQLVILSFSDEETIGARKLLNSRSIEFSETRVFEGIYNLVKRSESIC